MALLPMLVLLQGMLAVTTMAKSPRQFRQLTRLPPLHLQAIGRHLMLIRQAVLVI